MVWGVPPHANFSCLSKKCRTDDGAAPVYDLPLTAKRCPVCGSSRIRRLFDAVNVVGNNFTQRQAIESKVVAPEYDRQMQVKSAAIQAAAPTQVTIPAGQALTAARTANNAAFSMPVLNGLRGLMPKALGRDH